MPGRRLDIDLEFLWLDQKAAREPPVALVFFRVGKLLCSIVYCVCGLAQTALHTWLPLTICNVWCNFAMHGHMVASVDPYLVPAAPHGYLMCSSELTSQPYCDYVQLRILSCSFPGPDVWQDGRSPPKGSQT
ncbi:hypothetical protein K456DRAFT_229135 [Colletotrichum gloeosporioides 23]|nr:hypothetical protein K456DRAFT_229135 [Colletotrichum gloeosporioides 23]